MNLSPVRYTQLKKRLKTKYAKEKLQTFKAFRSIKSPLSAWLKEHGHELKEYSSLNWYFLNELMTYAYFEKQPSLLGKEGFGPLEEEVFEKWNNSEFADVFLKSLNKGLYLGKASKETLKKFEQHLISFGERHVLKSEKISKAYRAQTSLGEIERRGKISKLLETTLHFEGKDLALMTTSLKEMKDFSVRIETALKIIRKQSPTSWDRFSAFTEVIIPINQSELVSYSHQNLPGHSMINLYHRDFVDLMDDLLHENGHHHLNYYLNLGKLIEEPIDNIYYSPWRRTLRPLRGIYHAYFTFFWAFKLFADLSKAKEVDTIFYVFNKEQKEKIIWRAVEEFHMLNYTFQDLKWAYREGLINKTGWMLVDEQQKELLKFKKLIPFWEKKLKVHKKDLKDLKKTLAEASKDYLK